MNHPRVSLIIPNRDGQLYLGVCLNAIAGQTLQPFETLVVDDASNDRSVEYLRAEFPWVTVIPSSDTATPQGFAGSCNTGIRRAKGELIALLNNDTQTEPAWLEEMVKALQAEPRAGSCACRMLQKDPRYINAAGLQLSSGAACSCIGDGDEDGAVYDQPKWIFGPSGGAALWRREVLDTIGLFDEDYFAYYEDADLAFRAQARGFACLYAPASRVIHLEGRCPSLTRIDKVGLRIRNAFWFAWGNLPAGVLARHLGPVLWSTLGRYLLKYGMRPWKVEGRSFWRAFTSLLFSPKKLMRKRSERVKDQTVDDQVLEAWLGINPFTNKE